MITADPFHRLLIEHELTLSQLSQLSGISLADLSAVSNGRKITKHNIETLCKILKCQPYDIIEFTKTESKGHWEWIEGE